jgi:hypothetical protein
MVVGASLFKPNLMLELYANREYWQTQSQEKED